MSKVVIDRATVEQVLEAWDGGDIEWFKRAYTVMENLRAALVQERVEYEVAPNGRRSAVLTTMMNARTRAATARGQAETPQEQSE